MAAWALGVLVATAREHRIIAVRTTNLASTTPLLWELPLSVGEMGLSADTRTVTLDEWSSEPLDNATA